jgi:hypothetical protein
MREISGMEVDRRESSSCLLEGLHISCAELSENCVSFSVSLWGYKISNISWCRST